MGRTVRSFEELIPLVDEMEDELFNLIEDAVNDAFEETYREAKRRSSGTFTLAQLRNLDHPYASRHGRPLLPADTFNIQSGELYASWFLRLFKGRKGFMQGELINISDHIDYVNEGTDTMIERPVTEYLERYLEEQIITRIREALIIYQTEY